MNSTSEKTQNQEDPFAKKPKKACNVYVDGFNLYYGAVRGTAHKWLNLEKFFQYLRPADNVLEINYFTARMHGPQGVRQSRYLSALETTPTVNVILGKYKTKRVKCNVPSCVHSGDRRFATWEEKRTDVNIAVKMVDDAYQNKCEIFVLVSGDSDLVPVIHQIKSRFPDKKVIVYVPARTRIRGAAVEIRAAADSDKTLPLTLLPRCQFPPTIPDGVGGSITKPPHW